MGGRCSRLCCLLPGQLLYELFKMHKMRRLDEDCITLLKLSVQIVQNFLQAVIANNIRIWILR